MNYEEYFFKFRIKLILTTLSIIGIVYISYFGILMVGNSNKLNTNISIMNRTPTSFIELGKQVQKLQIMTSNIDNYTLNDIKSSLLTTANLTNLASSEFKAQYESWLFVKGQINKDADSFIQVKQKLDQVQKLQDDEIVRLKELLDKSTKPSLLSSSLNLLISFLLGVLSSIFSSHVYSKWLQKKQNHITL